MVKIMFNKIRRLGFSECSFDKWIYYPVVILVLFFALIVADLRNRVLMLELDTIFLYDVIEALVENQDPEFVPDCPNPELDDFDNLDDGEHVI